MTFFNKVFFLGFYHKFWAIIQFEVVKAVEQCLLAQLSYRWPKRRPKHVAHM